MSETISALENWQSDMVPWLAALGDPSLDKLESWQRAMVPFLASLDQPPTPPTGKLPLTRMGVHWICDMVRQSDKEYMAALRPAVIKMVNPSPDRVKEALGWIDPAGHVALRYHPISEQHAEAAADPAGTAKKHAKYWIDQLNGNYKQFDRTKVYVMGLNEPPVHNDAEEKRHALYTETFLRELQPHGIRAYVFNFSVGWPREVAGKIIWDNFLHLTDLINQTQSYGCVHEYWHPTVMNGWNSYANRVSRCPMKIKFVIGECAYTRQLINPPVGQPWGWDPNLTAGTYAAMLWQYADEVDPGKVFAVCPFTTSYGGAEWKSKDTANAHGAILARKHNFTWPNPWPSYAVLPPIEPPEEDEMQYRLLWPKFEKITQRFSTNHSGLDLSMVTGTPLYAMADGVVKFSGVDEAANGGYGQYLRINLPALHMDQFVAHLSRRDVVVGQKVTRGQQIALSGNTGNSTGPHLHLEIRLKEEDNHTDRKGVSTFSRGQVCPASVRAVLHGMFGSDER